MTVTSAQIKKKKYKKLKGEWMNSVAQTGCIISSHWYGHLNMPCVLHHPRGLTGDKAIGESQKASDFDVIPLQPVFHNEPLLSTFPSFPSIHLDTDHFVSLYGNEDVLLKLVHDKMKRLFPSLYEKIEKAHADNDERSPFK